MLILAGFLAILSGSHLLPLLLVSSSCGGSISTNTGSTPGRTIALIDQLGMEYPNPAFANNISQTAESAGFSFDYYPAKTATLDFFVNLPRHNYSIIILRTHGTGLVATDAPAIVTSDHYTESQHTIDQLTDRVAPVDVNGTRYFGLESGFVSDVMCGRFPGTVVLAMFCEGAGLTLLAKAFLEKGSSAYIGWDKVVSVSHTDLAFTSLAKLLVEGKTVDWSVQNVMTTLGPDPVFGARLTSYTRSSFPSENTPWWQEEWYVLSAGMAAAIVGLARVRTPRIKDRKEVS